MTILSLLLVLLLSMVNGATRLWRLNENRVESYREARAALNVLSEDLSCIYSTPNQTFFSTQKDKTPAISKGTTKTGMDGRLFFLTALPKTAQPLSNKSGSTSSAARNKGDLCTVGYFLAYDKTSLTGKGTASYNLYRYLRGSDDTFSSLVSGDLLASVTIDTAPTNADTEVLAKNINGFEVTAYTVDPAAPEILTPFDRSATTPMPDMLEISLTAINNDAAKRFGSDKDQWEDPNSITNKREQRLFKTRIYLPRAAQVKINAVPTPTPTPSPIPS